MDLQQDKNDVRKALRFKLAAMSSADRSTKSQLACALVQATPEFAAASVVMLYLSTAAEVDTAGLVLRCWQMGKTVVVPKTSWNERQMMPVEINSLTTGLVTNEKGIREPAACKPVPAEFIDLVIVPGLGFTPKGYRIGRGMGFYDRFLAQPDFVGVSCGLAFDEQLVEKLPVVDHDVPLNMLVSDGGIRRFTSQTMWTV